ncbi:MAG TPA: DNA repair protein RadA, partial [Candidatus Woesebacteria bacterium]|nr:DNA repair protein RadA [Candidatus Woesebacteria bacterium]
KKVKSIDTSRKKTGIFEFDRILGGGFVAGEAVLLTGEPGVGKSTLLLQSLKNLKTLYISGEEAAEQVKDRADRLGVKLDDLMFSDTLQVEGIVEGVEDMKENLDLIVPDSIQTVYSKDVDSAPGSVSQLRESSMKLIRMAKDTKVPIIIIGHITKEGEVAGPKTLEHMVDAVLQFEGDRVSAYRILRATKNRFGTTDEIGIFEMKGQGLEEVNNPLAFVEEDMQVKVPGKALVGVMEGKRPLFFEIQTLAVPSILAVPRRVVKGVDYNKVLLLLAVLQKQLHMSLGKFDIYVNVVGGVDVKSTSADLGIVASIISSVKDIPLTSSMMFTGEVGLLGEIRSIYGQDRIISEATRLNFKKIYSSKTSKTIRDLYRALSS